MTEIIIHLLFWLWAFFLFWSCWDTKRNQLKKILNFLSIGYYRASLENGNGLNVGDKVVFGDGKTYQVKVILKNDIIVKKINT